MKIDEVLMAQEKIITARKKRRGTKKKGKVEVYELDLLNVMTGAGRGLFRSCSNWALKARRIIVLLMNFSKIKIPRKSTNVLNNCSAFSVNIADEY